jgi:hypothetical protein
MARPSCLPAIAVLLSLLAGFASARIEEPRFAITALTLVGPASIPNGEARTYALKVNTERVAAGAGAAEAPEALTLDARLPAALVAGAAALTASEVDVARLRRDGALSLTLRCVDHEVRGEAAGSGVGARAGSSRRMGLPWWDKPATVRARLGGHESNALTVLCD